MLDPITEIILIKESKNKSYLNEIGVLTTLTVAGLAFMVPKVYRYVKQYQKLRKDCGKLKGEEKQDCVSSVKSGFRRDALFILKKARLECNQTTDPEKCRSEIDDRIRMITF
jgi:hypothetical protein